MTFSGYSFYKQYNGSFILSLHYCKVDFQAQFFSYIINFYKGNITVRNLFTC